MVKKLIVLTLLGAAFVGGYVSHHPRTVTVVRQVDDVTSFNDGWNTALYGDAE